MTEIVLFFLIFVGVGAGFLMVNLIVGRFLRPHRPSAEKETIYECGEPTIGSAWIQFDLRFYVVALLFVIFDVEMAFFFPWGTVFGNAAKLSRDDLTVQERARLQHEMLDKDLWAANRSGLAADSFDRTTPTDMPQLPGAPAKKKATPKKVTDPKEAQIKALNPPKPPIETAPMPRLSPEEQIADQRSAAQSLAWIAFTDILVFFGVLLVGFAYLWKRGDLDWVRSTAAQVPENPPAVAAVTER